MITREGRPVLASVWRNPSDIASTDTSTPTTPAMPTTTTSELPSRRGTFCRLISVIGAAWFSHAMASPVSGQRVHDAQPAHPERRRQADGERQRAGEQGRQEPRLAGDEQRREAAAGGGVESRDETDGDHHA